METLLRDDEWTRWTQDKIAKHCGVSRVFVNQLSQALDVSSKRLQDGVREVERNGTMYEQNTANIGKPAPLTEPEVRASSEPLVAVEAALQSAAVAHPQRHVGQSYVCSDFEHRRRVRGAFYGEPSI